MSVIKGIKEEILIQRLIKGDLTAFELLFHFYYPGLVTFASQFILNHAEAEEIVQDFFVHLWEKHKDVKKSNSLKNYFFTSVKNRSLNYLKKERLNEELRKKLKELAEHDELYEPDIFVASELQDRIKKAIEALPPRTNEVFTLSRFKGFSNDEIASHLNISKRTVETQISNALKILRERLKDYIFLLWLL